MSIGETGGFRVKPYLIPLRPAEFVVSDLFASSNWFEEGDDVTFSVKVACICNRDGSYTVEFRSMGR